ncbi:MAG: plasmid replication initiator TrfA [Dokdonella sp.]
MSATDLDEEFRQIMASIHTGADLATHDALMRQLESVQKRREATAHTANGAAARKPNTEAAVVVAKAAQRALRRPRPAPRRPDPNAMPVVWGDDLRGIPNDLARTGLFNIKQSEPRRILDNEPIASLKNITMFFSGPELRVRDEDVLLQCFHFQRNLRWGDPWSVNGRDFLQAMHWSDGKRGYRDLFDSLLRLSKGHLSILRTRQVEADAPVTTAVVASNGFTEQMAKAEEDGFVLKAGRLIEIEIEHGGRGAATVITVEMNKRTNALWQTMGYTLVNWEQRLDLTSTLARFLHRFYSSHRDPFALKVETILRLTGSGTASLSKFRQLLRDALDALVKIEFLSAYWIDSADRVNVRRLHVAAIYASAPR